MSDRDFIITGGKLVDPHLGRSEDLDVLVKEGRIEAVEKPGSFSSQSDVDVVDASGKIVTPGLIDLHVHLREPGEEWKETVASGAAAAAAGGFTTVCCMPNTRPTNDTAQITEYILEKSAQARKARVLPIGAITVGRKGEALAPMIELQEAGCVAFSDDGDPVMDPQVMRRALEYSSMLGAVLTVHEEDKNLSDGFSMNESALSLKLGLKGMPPTAEEVMIARDIELAKLTRGRVHFCHVSTGRGVELIRRAKAEGIPVTAETAPHYFTLDESAVEHYDTLAKVSMPLRSEEDKALILEGLRDGTLDCIASDHAPHEADSKNVEFDKASFGFIGLQSMLPLTLAKVRDGSLSLERAIEALSASPAKCFNLPQATLKKGSVADIAIIDLERTSTYTPDIILSKSKNCPYLGWEFTGVAVKTFVEGRCVFDIDTAFEKS